MADPTLLTHTTPYSRWTLGKVRDLAMMAVGGVVGDLNVTELGILDDLINATLNRWRHLAKNGRRWAEIDTTITWASGNTREVLPADFGELVGRHIWRADSAGAVLGTVEVIPEESYNDGFDEGAYALSDIWTGENPIARLYREEASTRKRVLWIYPQPAAGDKFKILYLAEAEKLVNTGDVLEAPIAYNLLVAYDSAIEWMQLRGNTEKVLLYENKREKILNELTGSETGRPSRARFYDEVGYAGSRQGEPAVRHPLFALRGAE